MTFDEFKACQREADKRMKASNGHRFITILKTRCEYCNCKPDSKIANKTCRGWFHCFLANLSEVMMERYYL